MFITEHKYGYLQYNIAILVLQPMFRKVTKKLQRCQKMQKMHRKKVPTSAVQCQKMPKNFKQCQEYAGIGRTGWTMQESWTRIE